MVQATTSMAGLAISAACFAAAMGHADAVVGRGGVAAFASPMHALPQMRGSVRAGHHSGVCGLGMQFNSMYDDVVGDFKVGESVQLKADTWFFHVWPKEFPDGKTIEAGTIGTIKKIVLKPDCKSTPTRPIQVEFTEPRKWFAHMEKEELKRV